MRASLLFNFTYIFNKSSFLSVRSKDVSLPQQLQRAMATEAEAAREARAKVIAAEGEMKAARALKEASDIMCESPASLQVGCGGFIFILQKKNYNFFIVTILANTKYHCIGKKFNNNFPVANGTVERIYEIKTLCRRIFQQRHAFLFVIFMRVKIFIFVMDYFYI